MIHPFDFLFEPIKKFSFIIQKNKSLRWYSHTTDYVTQGVNPNEFLFEIIQKGNPFMLARLGTSELHTILNYIVRKESFPKKTLNYLKGIYPEYWWGKFAFDDLAMNSGFFPSNARNLDLFSELYLKEIANIDVLLTWLRGESILESYCYLNQKRTNLYIFDSEPYFYEKPWTLALKGKKVLVIHPFEDSIRVQYPKRNFLFSKRVLPDFELKTIKAPQSIRGNDIGFSNWFEALEDMKNKIDKCDFDIALIGAGCYGLPLASYVKNKGKIGMHLGGFLQLFFGIKGNRWVQNSAHREMMNDYWKNPFPEEYPNNFQKLDHGSYW